MALNLDLVPDIAFAQKDAAKIEANIMALYEASFFASTGTRKKLFPGDPIRLFLEVVCELIVGQRVVIDFAGKQNLLKYSRDDYLENLAALYGERARRLKPASAETTLRFSLSAALPFDVLVAQGTQAMSSGDIIFSTTRNAPIVAGNRHVDLPARCLTPGVLGNGLAPGAVSTLVNWALPYAANVANTTESAGGRDREDDEHLRERVWMTPESFSTCGPTGAYEFWARSADADIVDVAVHSAPEIAGQVWIFPLMRGGELPNQGVLDAVYAICDDKRRRPLTDQVFVKTPVRAEYEIRLTYWILISNQTLAGSIQAAVYQAVQEFVLWQRARIGRDVNPSRLTALCVRAGAKRVEIEQPAFRVLEPWEVAVLRDPPEEAVQIAYGGLESE